MASNSTDPIPSPSDGAPSGARAGSSLWRRHRTALAAIVVAAAVVVAGGLWVLYERSSSSPGPRGASGPVPYSTARTVALAQANRYASSSWNVLAAASLLGPSAVPLPLSIVSANASAAVQALGCHLTFPTPNATLTVPASNVSADLGLYPAWSVVLANGTGAILVVAVLEGAATVVAVLTGGQCATYAQLVIPVATAVVDSPKVASVAGAAGGDAFLAAHPGTSLSLRIAGGIPLVAPTEIWNMTYLACPSVGVSAVGTGAYYTVDVDPASGRVVATSNGTLNCSFSLGGLSSPIPLVRVLVPAGPLAPGLLVRPR